MGLVLAGTATLLAAAPTAEHALELTPVQKGVGYDQPEPADAKRCTVQAEKKDRRVGWLVLSPDGETLRAFWDNNADNVVDQWSYFHDGLEVYRDIDEDYNGKRWLPRCKAGTPRASSGCCLPPRSWSR
jgi:hypothetical protein